jgi:alpha-galactosidase
MRKSIAVLPGMLLLSILYLNINAQKFDKLAMTPPMGWNSWNKFACDGINEKLIKATADAMVSTGMKDAGYQYIVIDDCWQIDRDSAGNIVADPQKFPSGIKALADYIHGKGLKFGIYTCAGNKTCQRRPGSRGYEFQDARQYAVWGVDFLKEDWCNTTSQNAQESYKLMRDALYKAGRPIVFSLCEWGMSKPWEWAQEVGNEWRTTGDIEDQWGRAVANEGKVWGGGVVINLDMQKGLEKYAGPGHWNDPDMLEIGNGGLTPAEEKSHFSLWCMLAAPLMAGNDLRQLSPETRELLTNKEAIAIDQDALGKQGYKIGEKENVEIYLKPLMQGDTAVCLFNRNDDAKNTEIRWSDYHLSSGHSMRDLWKHEDLGTSSDIFKITVAKHGIVLLRLHAK